MNMKQTIADFLLENSKLSNKEIADNIREAKGLDNHRDNIVIFQEKRSICSTAKKLKSMIKSIDESAELEIKIKNKTWRS